MALTSLEAISEKLNDIRKETIETILMVSGSSAITKNEYGVTIVENLNPVSSLVFKNLSKPKYDEVELIKAIDVDVKELMPNIPTRNLDLVPRPLYTEQIDLVEDLRRQVEKLTITITDLNTQIITLQAQVQTEINNRLSIEQTNDALANQIDTLTGTINDFTGQISTSLQKSVDESILRASLQSQNTGFKAQINALIQQINSLNSIIEGLQAQLGAVRQQKDIEQETKGQGGTNINKAVSANFDEKGAPGDATMSYKMKNARDKAHAWRHGENLTLVNNDLEPVQVSITANWNQNQRWFSIPKSNFEISPGATERIKFIGTPNGVSFGRRDNTVFYDGSLAITVKRKDGTSETKSFKTTLGVFHPKSYS
jgi:TolA-binding protein